MRKSADVLAEWLSSTWERPERSYNPELREFFASLLGYPKKGVITEDRASIGYPDIKLLSEEGVAWVVGDLKKDDNELLDPTRRGALWTEKRKYVDGLTRYVFFLTAHYLWIVTSDGLPIPGFDVPFDLRTSSLESLRGQLRFLNYEASSHERRWQEFVEGSLPYVYLKLDNPDTLRQLRGDLRVGFQELTDAATKAIAQLEIEYQDYAERRADIDRNLVGHLDTQRRARVRLDLRHGFVRRLFEEALDQFEEQYGRDIEASKPQEQKKRVREAYVADSAAALVARVLFLRLVEDLGLAPRRLSNGGPKDWAKFVHHITDNARTLVRWISEDMERAFREPFAPTVFDWIQHANGEMDTALQRLIMRLNAYDFAGLSEEILGDIYQQFLPAQKRKRLGEFYTPASIVEWILDKTVREHGLGAVLDPACGSGSFLVRYAHWRLEDARQRGHDVAAIAGELQAEAWGFDLNPFAAFISLFQLLWAHLRLNPLAPPPPIHVHNLNSLSNDRDIANLIGEDKLPPGAMERDNRKWKYVLGNPPYIRAERVKYGEEMRRTWAHIWGQNADTGLVFLYRAITEWLETGGFLGMVVSGGYANSETAAKVWQLLHPGKMAALRKIVWLEFIEEEGKQERLWEVARVPMILIIERVPAKVDDEIELNVPHRWPSVKGPVKIPYSEFFNPRINPRVTNDVAPHGDYLLPLLELGDVALLRRLNSNGNGSDYQPLGTAAKWTYGIQRGGVEVTEEPIGNQPIQVIPGQSLAVAWGGLPAGWIDLESVASRPYGKLSLWRQGRSPKSALIQVPTIAKALVASVNGNHAALNSVIVGETDSNLRAKAIAAYVNSRVARYYWALKLRTAVVQGYYSTMYPRTLEALPWPKSLSADQERQLAAGYDRLAGIAARAKDNPNERLLAETERRLEAGRMRITEPSLNLRFDDPAGEVPIEELSLEGARIAPLAEFANPEIAEFVYLLLTLTLEEEAIVKAQDLQRLVLPKDYLALLDEHTRRMKSFAHVERDFMAELDNVNATVYTSFGLTQEEQAIIEQRLSCFPLNRLQPRYPWQAVRPRPIKAYMEDRFA